MPVIDLSVMKRPCDATRRLQAKLHGRELTPHATGASMRSYAEERSRERGHPTTVTVAGQSSRRRIRGVWAPLAATHGCYAEWS